MSSDPSRVLSIPLVFALSPARYRRGSVQRDKLHRLPGGVPAGSQDRGHHSYWRNRRQCWGERSRLPQTAQLRKEISLYTTLFLTSLPLLISLLQCFTSADISVRIKNSSFAELALCHALSNLSPVVNTGNHHESRTKWSYMKVSFLSGHSFRLFSFKAVSVW